MVEDDGGVGRRGRGGLETHPTGGVGLRAKIFRQARPKIGVDPPFAARAPLHRPELPQNRSGMRLYAENCRTAPRDGGPDPRHAISVRRTQRRLYPNG